MPANMLGPMLVFACFTSWGFLPIFWKMMGQVFDSNYTMLMRLIWSAIAYGIFILIEKKGKLVLAALKDKKLCLTLFITGAALTINWWIYIYAVSINKVIESSLAYYLNPILAVIAGYFLFKERLNKMQWAALGIAVLGIAYSVISYGQIPWFAIIIAITFTLYGALKKTVDIDGDVALFLETLFILPFGLVYLIYLEATGSGYVGTLTMSQYSLMPLAGLVTAIPLIAYARGIKTTSLALSGILMFVNPTLQLIVAVALFGESFKTADYIMFPCVWLALIIFVGSSFVKRKDAPVAEKIN